MLHRVHTLSSTLEKTDLMARRATLYARSASCGSKAEKRYLAKVCMGTLSLWMTSPRPLNGPAGPGERQPNVYSSSQQ